jgi:hypothetical protein
VQAHRLLKPPLLVTLGVFSAAEKVDGIGQAVQGEGIVCLIGRYRPARTLRVESWFEAQFVDVHEGASLRLFISNDRLRRWRRLGDLCATN